MANTAAFNIPPQKRVNPGLKEPPFKCTIDYVLNHVQNQFTISTKSIFIIQES